MATYVIGDVQGCFLSLLALLEKIDFDSNRDQAIFLGDVINRGPSSLEVLRLIVKNQDSMSIVLGNHEIFALAIYLGAIKDLRTHSLQALFAADDGEELMAWLRCQPLMRIIGDQVLLHAGILPSINVEEAYAHAQLVQVRLQSDKAKRFLSDFYQKRLISCKEGDSKKKRDRFTLAYLTLIRMCGNEHTIDLGYTGSPDKAPKKLTPWFKLRKKEAYRIYFGHWAALGIYQYHNYYCLDSGCAWGQQLSALCLENHVLTQVFNSDFLGK